MKYNRRTDGGSKFKVQKNMTNLERMTSTIEHMQIPSGWRIRLQGLKRLNFTPWTFPTTMSHKKLRKLLYETPLF